MKLEYALSAAEEFGKMFYSLKDLKIKDILLYGSTSQNKKLPRDLDIMLIHSNEVLDKFMKIAENKLISDIKKLNYLESQLKDIELFKILKETKTLKLIKEEKLNLKYLNFKYFQEKKYRDFWEKFNKKHFDPSIKKGGRTKETFLEFIFSQGKLWNPSLKIYNLDPRQKYPFNFTEQ